MAEKREAKIISLLRNLISEFFLKLNLRDKIISITHIEISHDLKSAKIFISIYPEGNEEKILDILKKEKVEIKKHISAKTKMKFLPELEFRPDKGEKNRQRIEELLKK